MKRILEAGAVGLNIEDSREDGSLGPKEAMVEKLKAVKELKEELDLDFVINARIDTYLINQEESSKKLDETLDRAKAYLEAGADCIFVPGSMEEDTQKILASEIPGPLNLLLTNKTYDLENLNKLGVKRLSIGSALARWSYGQVVDLAKLLKAGDTDRMRKTSFSLASSNEFFK